METNAKQLQLSGHNGAIYDACWDKYRKEWITAGGDGVVREFEFLQPLTVSVLTQHRSVAPYGLAGGGEGQCGRQVWVSKAGERVLEPIASLPVEVGDRIVIETPGGGGWGA